MSKLEPPICEDGGSGLLFPAFSNEHEWNTVLRVILYFVGVIYTFLGIGIITDMFMGAIEHITSQKKRVKVRMLGDGSFAPIRQTTTISITNKKSQIAPQDNTTTNTASSRDGETRLMTVKVWNDTVANLTLMALGSSAPEILLALIELLGNEFYSGQLGPSTIVGSAAFNLFLITAVCTMAVVEVKKINDLGVFAVTASFSLFAYIWLVIILLLISPDVIDIWEGLITLLLFPVLVLIAYLADRGYFTRTKDQRVNYSRERYIQLPLYELSQGELMQLAQDIRDEFGQDLTDETVLRILEAQRPGIHSRATYRVQALRRFSARRKISLTDQKQAYMSHPDDFLSNGLLSPHTPQIDPNLNTCRVFFDPLRYAVLESGGTVKVHVRRQIIGAREGDSPADLSFKTRVYFKTVEGSAKEQTDFIPLDSYIDFAEGEEIQTIDIEIIDDDIFEEDAQFYIDLISVEMLSLEKSSIVHSEIRGSRSRAMVTIIDDDDPGVIAFAKEDVLCAFKLENHVVEDDVSLNYVLVDLIRSKGSSGDLKIKYHLEDGSARGGIDYEQITNSEEGEEDNEGVVSIASGELSAQIRINLLPPEKLTMSNTEKYSRSMNFRLVCDEIEGGALFDRFKDGGDNSIVCTITIVPPGIVGTPMNIYNKVKSRFQTYSYATSDWRGQFTEAIYVNGSKEDQQDASLTEWTLHILNLPWKLLFAIVPPLHYGKGYATFVTSLLFIGLVTALVGDLAALLGCALGISDAVTAITLVALGTSLPDTFASKTAAINDKYADASIGNVTGSNSVNVFLGLGIPWTIGAIYWASVGATDEWKAAVGSSIVADYPNGAFVVESGDLAFSVLVFTICALFCIGGMMFRRKRYGGELGGPYKSRVAYAAFYASLWVIYIALSIWKAES